MGMERIINLASAPADWAAIQREAAAAGLGVTVRMIDGLPAFPDEVPEPGWREVRISTASGMMTVSQRPGRMAIVVWGNAEGKLREEWDSFAQACAKAVGGTFDAAPGPSCGH
jgi:hypothetical protein